MELKLTPEQVWNLMVYGTAGMVIMFLMLVLLVLYFSSQTRKYNEELAQLRAKHQEEIKQAKTKGNTEDEYLMISGGRKIKNKNWKGNTLKDSHIMD